MKPYVIVHMIQPYLHKSNYIHNMQNTFYCLITKSHLYFICLLNFVKIGEWKLVSDVSFMRRLIFDWAIPVVWAQVHRLNSFRIIESMFERLRFCTIIHYIWSHIFTCKTIKWKAVVKIIVNSNYILICWIKHSCLIMVY